jgi:YD repeat-containing protein
VALSRNGSNQAKFVYDERGNVTSVTYSNGTYAANEYDAANRLKSVKNYNAAGGLLDSYTYSYDANSNITSIVTGSGGEVFGDNALTVALLDRITHHAHVIPFVGESYRFKESRQKLDLGELNT